MFIFFFVGDASQFCYRASDAGAISGTFDYSCESPSRRVIFLSVYTVYCIMNGPLEMPKIPPRPSQNAQDLIRGLIKAGVSRVCWVKCGTPELVTGYQFICFDPYTVACHYSIIFNLRRKPWIFKSASKFWNRLAICAVRHVTYDYVFFVLFVCQVKPQERLSLDACISHSWISTVGGGSLSKILKSLGMSSF